jgi:iron complex transport system permease protein
VSNAHVATLNPAAEIAAPRAGRSPATVYAALGTLAVVLFILELMIGVVAIPIGALVDILTGQVPERESWTRIVLDFRLPRAWAAILAGSGVAMTGLLLQTLFRNPLADPWVLGIIHGAGLGVAMMVVAVSWFGIGLLASFGFAGDLAYVVTAGLGAAGLMAALAAVAPRVTSTTLLITGVVLGFTSQGFISIVLHLAPDEAVGSAFSAWFDGDFTGIGYNRLFLFTPLIAIAVAAAFVQTKSLNTLMLGDQYAASLGLSVAKARRRGLAVAALLAGTVTAFCGPIGFLGILVPHACRLLLSTADHRVLMPAVVLGGAALALGADLLTHLPWSRHLLHVNAVTGAVGGPIVLWMLLRRRGRWT